VSLLLGLVVVLVFLFVLPSKSNTKLVENSKDPEFIKKDPIVIDLVSEEEKKERKAKELVDKALVRNAKEINSVFVRKEYEALKAEIAYSPQNIERLDLALKELKKKHEEEARLNFEDRKSKIEELLIKGESIENEALARHQYKGALAMWDGYPKEFEDTSYWEKKKEEVLKLRVVSLSAFVGFRWFLKFIG
jgi:hypothetical protein